MQQRQKVDSSLGVARLFNKDPKIISPGQTNVMEGYVNCRPPNAGKWVAVEPPKTSSLPGAIMVANGLASLPTKLLHRIPLIIKNESDHITISPKSVIAEVNAIQSIKSISRDNSDTLKKLTKNQRTTLTLETL